VSALKSGFLFVKLGDEMRKVDLRWLFLIWSGLVYLFGALGYFGAGWGNDCHTIWGVGTACYSTFFPALNASSIQLKAGPQFPALLVFSVCLALLCLLGWAVLSMKVERRRYWLACLLQGGLVLVAKLVIQGDMVVFGNEIALALYLALCVQAIIMLRQIRPVLLATAGYLILFSFGAALEGGWQYVWQARLPIIGYSILIPLLILLVAFYVMDMRTHQRLALVYHQLEAAYNQLAASNQQIESLTLMTERQRIARDLHDTLSQDLVALIRQLDLVNAHLKLNHTDRALAIVQEAAESARTALTEARETVENLRNQSADGLWSEAMLKEINHFEKATGIACEYDPAVFSSLAGIADEHVLLIIREGLTNIAHHAHAQYAWIRSRIDQDWLKIEVGDDGIGFDPANIDGRDGHYGLLGLRERAHLLGGEVEIQSKPGRGTVLTFSLPDPKITEKAPL
jgi:NarL family two-component system sensor histidine kinase YdfH